MDEDEKGSAEQADASDTAQAQPAPDTDPNVPAAIHIDMQEVFKSLNADGVTRIRIPSDKDGEAHTREGEDGDGA
jgi:hypothetical protein